MCCCVSLLTLSPQHHPPPLSSLSRTFPDPPRPSPTVLHPPSRSPTPSLPRYPAPSCPSLTPSRFRLFSISHQKCPATARCARPPPNRPSHISPCVCIDLQSTTLLFAAGTGPHILSTRGQAPAGLAVPLDRGIQVGGSCLNNRVVQARGSCPSAILASCCVSPAGAAAAVHRLLGLLGLLSLLGRCWACWAAAAPAGPWHSGVVWCGSCAWLGETCYWACCDS